ncbi:MAG: hypothetical protein OJJ21_20510 [Ferrovibrio sp.]|uniref:DUF2946 family protein n=1 Tax=Ferrovibrio sp. TaxID=1917215 RepID=UPI0026060833|nr:DUF2946 family protein [Ferrovibrio sp.]MCW0235991.1 hypothetical protein [Ferrovibrio sp.]
MSGPSAISRSAARPAPGRRLGRLAALLALCALVFHGLLPLTQQVARQVQAANGIEQVVLCSALGFRTLALKDGAPVDTDPAKSEKSSRICPVCFATANLSHAILPAGALPVLPSLAITVLYGAAPASTAASAAYLPPQARAPPAFVS